MVVARFRPASAPVQLLEDVEAGLQAFIRALSGPAASNLVLIKVALCEPNGGLQSREPTRDASLHGEGSRAARRAYEADKRGIRNQ